jgi:hypothetical protein
MAERSIVDIGKYLQRYGLRIGENPAFGGVGKGHSPTGYHPKGMAIDVTDWRPDVSPAYEGGKPIPWKQRTGELSWRAKQLGLFDEALGPGDSGHDTHVHLALAGTKYITNPQLDWLATGRYKTPTGELSDVMPMTDSKGAAPDATTSTANKENQLAGYLLGSLLLNQQKESPQIQKKRQMIQEFMRPPANSGIVNALLASEINSLLG